jgi:hypothetical protein
MGIFGKVLATPLRIVNAPIRALEDLANGCEKPPEDERMFSKILDILAEEVEKVDEGKKPTVLG